MEYLGIIPPAPPTSGFSVAKQLLAKTKAGTSVHRKSRALSDANDTTLPCSEDLARQKKRKKVCLAS